MTSEYLSYAVRYKVDNTEEESDSDSENCSDSESDGNSEMDSVDGWYTSRVASVHNENFMSRINRHQGLTGVVRMKWTLYLLDKCEHKDHWSEQETSKDTFLTLRDCLVNF